MRIYEYVMYGAFSRAIHIGNMFSAIFLYHMKDCGFLRGPWDSCCDCDPRSRRSWGFMPAWILKNASLPERVASRDMKLRGSQSGTESWLSILSCRFYKSIFHFLLQTMLRSDCFFSGLMTFKGYIFNLRWMLRWSKDRFAIFLRDLQRVRIHQYLKFSVRWVSSVIPVSFDLSPLEYVVWSHHKPHVMFISMSTSYAQSGSLQSTRLSRILIRIRHTPREMD